MGECRGGGAGGGGDCLIKLFGKTIPVPEAGDAKDLQNSGSSIESDDAKESRHQQDTSDAPPQPEVVDAEDPKSSPAAAESQSQQPGGGDGEASNNHHHNREKLKKPDKVLPCPRCNSMDTKFCYFNNYNVNQPRHFCKNCQRYWTAGGAMRNVPVGAGRRKNKNAVAASQFLQRVRAALPLPAAGDGDPLRTGNGTVLSFGHEQVGHHVKEKLLLPIGNAGGNHQSVGPCSEGSSSTSDDKNLISGSVREKVTAADKPAVNGAQHPNLANINGATMWPYSCAPPSQAYYPPAGIAIPVYPAAAPAYWGCMVPGGCWSLPWPPVQQQSPATTTTQGLSSPTSVSSSGVDSLALGKHAREEGDEGRISGKVWAPKTIRIDDADEVARSSIWSLIGVKGDSKQSADTGGRKHGSTVFEPKRDAKTAKQAMMITSSPLHLHANPVALTRSLTFQEGS